MDQALGDFLRHLSLEKNASPYTVKSYREDLTQAVTFFRDRLGLPAADPERITTRLLRAYLAWLSDRGYAKATVARRLAAVRSWLRYLCRQGALKANPAEGLRGPRQDKKLPHFLSANDVGKLLAAPEGDDAAAKRDRAMLETLYSAGLRVSELVGMNLADLNLDDGVLMVRGKGKKERLALLGPPAVAAIQVWLGVRPTVAPKVAVQPAVFLNLRGGRLTTRSVARLLAKYLACVGVDPRTSPHTLRHTFATHLVNAGADIRGVQELLGHESLTTTQIYTHLTTERMQTSYRKAHPRA